MAAAADRAEVLILGGGEGATLREVLRDPSVRRCTMVDIDGQVVELSKRHLPEWSAGAFDDPRARVIIGDALRFLKDDRDRYGVVISDLTEPLPDSPSFPLFNAEVFRDVKARLAPGGVYVLQASTAGFHNMALHAKMARSLRGFFRYVRSFYTHVPAFDNDWAFLACSDEADVAALSTDRIEPYVRRLRGENYFYDAETHRRIFALPLYLRRELAKEGDVFA
jgi:spermidine synthase